MCECVCVCVCVVCFAWLFSLIVQHIPHTHTHTHTHTYTPRRSALLQLWQHVPRAVCRGRDSDMQRRERFHTRRPRPPTRGDGRCPGRERAASGIVCFFMVENNCVGFTKKKTLSYRDCHLFTTISTVLFNSYSYSFIFS